MEFACLALVAGRNFLMRPGTMRDGAFQQSTIFEVISEDRFEEIQIRSRFGIFQNALNYKQTPEACLKSSRRWNGDKMGFRFTGDCVVVYRSSLQRAWLRSLEQSSWSCLRRYLLPARR